MEYTFAVVNLIIGTANLVIIYYNVKQFYTLREQTKIAASDLSNSSDSLKSRILFDCLTSYKDIRKDRSIAILEKSEQKAKDYYRSYIDLFWFEYQLWKDDMIDDDIMSAWLYDREQSFNDDSIVCDGDKEVTYRSVWNELRDTGYFSPKDGFIQFMNLGHFGDIDAALELRSTELNTLT